MPISVFDWARSIFFTVSFLLSKVSVSSLTAVRTALDEIVFTATNRSFADGSFKSSSALLPVRRVKISLSAMATGISDTESLRECPESISAAVLTLLPLYVRVTFSSLFSGAVLNINLIIKRTAKKQTTVDMTISLVSVSKYSMPF